MWSDAIATDAFQRAIAGAAEYSTREIVRLFGIPEAEIANTLRAADAAGLSLAPLEITTCLRRGEIEIATRFEPAAQADYDALLGVHRRAPRRASVLARRLARSTSRSRRCWRGDDRTGRVVYGRPAGRPADRSPRLLGVRDGWRGRLQQRRPSPIWSASTPALIERYGAVSVEVARALADGARARFGASVGVGITGVAGPGGGTPEKPVGYVCLAWLMAGRAWAGLIVSSRARSTCPVTGPPCAIAPPPSRCT